MKIAIILFILILPIEAFAGRNLLSDEPDTADTIYYCHGTHSTGFHYSKSLKEYQIQNFNLQKFIIKLDKNFRFMKKKFTSMATGFSHWPCESLGDDRKNHRVACNLGVNYSFHINIKTGKYLQINAMGYVYEPQWEIIEERTDDPNLTLNDSVSITMGMCDTFN